jgi:hypothetical protein
MWWWKGGRMNAKLLAMVFGLWFSGMMAWAGGREAYKEAVAAMEAARTEQAVEDAFEKGGRGIMGDPEVRMWSGLLDKAREEAWKRVGLPHGIKVTHVGVKPKKLPDGRVVPERVFGFEVTGAYPVKEVWGAVVWMDVNGNVARRSTEKCLFTSESEKDVVQPGKSVIRESDIFLYAMGSDEGDPAAGMQAVVVIQRVLHVQK